MKKTLALYLASLLCALTALTGCSTSGVLNAIGKPFEAVGDLAGPALDPMLEGQAASQYAALTTQAGRLPSNDPQFRRVRAVAERIVKAVQVYQTSVPEADRTFKFDATDSFQWEVNVIPSQEKNAFAMPGGKMAVYTGILPIAENDDGLAAIMGHEVAHALLRHGRERVVKQIGISVALQMLESRSSDVRENPQLLALAGMGANVGLMLPWSRGDETEADELGLALATIAGYDPAGAVGVWQRMKAASQGQPPEFMSTHPSHDTRIQNLSRLAPKYQARYQKYAIR